MSTTGGSSRPLGEIPTELVDVGGRRLALKRGGAGQPTVVLETGLGVGSESWDQVQRAVAEFSHVCVFDRANRGESDPAPTPRTSRDMVADLHTLLTTAAVPGPYVLVGNSLGGLNALVYARQYPQEVAGIVLVDATHPDQFDRFTELLPPATPDDSAALQWFRQSFTIDYKDPLKNDEGVDLPASCAQARAVTSLGALPLVVLTSSAFLRDVDLGPDLGPRLHNLWQELHRDLARLSSRSVHTVTGESGHFIQRDQPQLVVEAVRQVVETVRGT